MGQHLLGKLDFIVVVVRASTTVTITGTGADGELAGGWSFVRYTLRKPIHRNFGNDFIYLIIKANWPAVINNMWSITFWNEDNECLIDVSQT